MSGWFRMIIYCHHPYPVYIHFGITSLHPFTISFLISATKGGWRLSFHLSVCLSVSVCGRISLKILDRFRRNLVERLGVCRGQWWRFRSGYENFFCFFNLFFTIDKSGQKWHGVRYLKKVRDGFWRQLGRQVGCDKDKLIQVWWRLRSRHERIFLVF